MIEVNGRRFRTLANPITVNGQKVKEVWASHDGMPSTKVYPDGLFVCKGEVDNRRTGVYLQWLKADGSANSSLWKRYIKHNYCFAVSSSKAAHGYWGTYPVDPVTIDLNIYSKFETPWNYDPTNPRTTTFLDDESRMILGLLNDGCLFHAHFDFGALTDEEKAQSVDHSGSKAGYELTHRHLIHETVFENYWYEYRRYLPDIAIYSMAHTWGLGETSGPYNLAGFIYDFALRGQYKSGRYDYPVFMELRYDDSINYNRDAVCTYACYYDQYSYKNWTETYDSINKEYVYTTTDPPEEAFYADMPSTTFSQ